MFKKQTLVASTIVLLFTVNGQEVTPKAKSINKEIVEDIKSKTQDWVPFEADENPLADLDDDELQRLTGTEFDPNRNLQASSDGGSSSGLPTSFDARSKWRSCTHPILAQIKCAACWAFGSTSTFTDRICIASGGAINPVMSY